MDNVIHFLNGCVWSPALVGLCLVAGLYFSFGTRFVQVRRFREMIKLLFYNDKSKKVGISSFQAFSMALSGRVGTGNIVGVATAIGYGGPGAIVWMWIVAFFGAGTSFSEATLSQIFKENHNGQFRGGPAYYIEKGLKCKWLAVVFAVCAVIASGLFMPPVQCNSIATAFTNTFDIKMWVVGLFVAVLIGLVVMGGVGRIARVAQIVAPVMAIIYVLLSIIVLIVNASVIPSVFADMIRSAFGMNAVLGGILGSTISWGVKRGIYSNEAGQGSGPIVAAAAKTSHPAKQGLVQAFSVYVDTLLVCTATAVMILATKTYNVYAPSGEILVAAQGVTLGEPDVSYTTSALATVLGNDLSGVIVSISLFFFAFTTIMAYYYYAETNLVYLVGKGRREMFFIWILRITLVMSVFFGSLKEAKIIWDLGDCGVGLMAWINIISIIMLSGVAFRTLRSYEKQKKMNIEPHFNPKELNIKNADFWEENPDGSEND